VTGIAKVCLFKHSDAQPGIIPYMPISVIGITFGIFLQKFVELEH